MTTSAAVYKHFDAAVKEISGLMIRGIASQRIVDRDDDVIEPSGIETSRFMANPVLLADHDHRFNIGVVRRLWVDPHARGGPALMFEATLLDPADPNRSERQREVIGTILAKARLGISISFTVHERSRQPVLDGQLGATFLRTELLEISSVNLPSCPTCLIERRAWGGQRDVPEIVLELADESHVRSCGCGGHADEDEIAIEIIDVPLADPAAKHHQFVGGELVDVDKAEVRRTMANVLAGAVSDARSGLGDVVAREITAAINKARGRVD